MTEESESSLSDTNAWVKFSTYVFVRPARTYLKIYFRYMAITFYQAILAFCLQDGGTALIQVCFRHYFSQKNPVFLVLIRWQISGRFQLGCSCCRNNKSAYVWSYNVYFFKICLWLCWPSISYTSSRLLFMGTHWSQIHNFPCTCSEIYCRHFWYRWIKVLVRNNSSYIPVYYALFVHFNSAAGIVHDWLNHKSAPQIDCIDVNAESELVQTPMRCLDAMDTTLLILSGISVVGVVFGIITTYKYGHKVFNQSHSSGRDATTFMAREMRKMTESNEVLPMQDNIKRSLAPAQRPTRRDTISNS